MPQSITIHYSDNSIKYDFNRYSNHRLLLCRFYKSYCITPGEKNHICIAWYKNINIAKWAFIFKKFTLFYIFVGDDVNEL
jgi:hypothetical protein